MTSFTPTQYSNFSTVTSLNGKTGDLTIPAGNSVATVVVAASDTYTNQQQRADFVCAGTGTDDVTINAAIDSLINGGSVVLLAGTYKISNPIVINRDWVTLRGECKPHWSAYAGGWPNPSVPGAPGGAKIVQTATGLDGLHIGTSNYHSTDARHKGIAIRDLYFYSSFYDGYGIFDLAITDICEISGCMLQGWGEGIHVGWDSALIFNNNIQDNAQTGLNVSGVNSVIYGNIIWDNGGAAGIQLNGSTLKCIGNSLGSCVAWGGGTILVTGPGNIIEGNTIVATNGNGIGLSGASRSIVSGNIIELTSVYNEGFAGNNTSGHGIAVGTSAAANNCVITGNIISNQSTAVSTGFAVDMLNTSTGCIVGHNIISGGNWNGGGAATNVAQGTGNTFVNNPGQQ